MTSCDMLLPPGFDGVVLPKKDIDRVIACNKNPYRREDDVDDEGEPLCTEYEGQTED
jgi:hypothetical protein